MAVFVAERPEALSAQGADEEQDLLIVFTRDNKALVFVPVAGRWIFQPMESDRWFKWSLKAKVRSALHKSFRKFSAAQKKQKEKYLLREGLGACQVGSGSSLKPDGHLELEFQFRNPKMLIINAIYRYPARIACTIRTSRLALVET